MRLGVFSLNAAEDLRRLPSWNKARLAFVFKPKISPKKQLYKRNGQPSKVKDSKKRALRRPLAPPPLLSKNFARLTSPFYASPSNLHFGKQLKTKAAKDF